MSETFTQADVRRRFVYVPEMGCLVWATRPLSDFDDKNKWAVWNSRYSGLRAGGIGPKGYRCINVFGKMRKASRLTWFYHHGVMPTVIDHIDGDVTNDAIDNLRNVTQAVNCKNRALGKRSTTGVSGVYRDGASIRAQINVDGRRIYLGSFSTIEEAASARSEAERKHGFHPNHGRIAPELRGE